jgi:sulfur carrier protein ThiS
MKVVVELIAMGRDGEVTMEVDDEATAESLIDVLGLRNVETYMSMINGQQIAPGDRAGRRLTEGDSIKFFPPLEGG